MLDYEFILCERIGPTVKITLNRPEKLNALNDQMMYYLDHALDSIEKDRDVRSVILMGAGKAFSAGYDLSPRKVPLDSVQDWRDHATKAGRDVVMKIWDLRVPVIAAAHGYALGGGCELLLASDISIAAAGTRIGEPEIRGTSSPPTLVMPWVVGMKHAKSLLLTGDLIDAEEAYRIGMLSRVVPLDDLEKVARTIAERLNKIPPIALELNKRGINNTFETMGLRTAVAYGVEIFTLLLNTEEAATFGRSIAEKGLRAAIEKRDTASDVP